jgi:hypothetical protein
MESIEKLTTILNNLSIEEIEQMKKLMENKKQKQQVSEASVSEASVSEASESEQESLNGDRDVREFASRIIQQEHTTTVTYKRFIESNAINCLITARTQVGKTDATKKFIETCLDYKMPVIVSCDNKTDQLDQIFQRISDDLETENVVFVKAGNTRLEKILSAAFKEKKQVIIFCLDNSSQIRRVKNHIVLLTASENIKIDRIALINDEGDVVTKDSNIETLNKEQSESHQEWLKMVEYLKRSNINLKRVFVTATPENVCYKYKVEHIIRLQVPHNYVGYEKIDYICLEDTKDIKEILMEEQNRRVLSKENGVILYCVDRKIYENGQDETFASVCSYLKKCVVNTYNGNGITARILNKRKFEKRLKEFIQMNNDDKSKNPIKYTNESTNQNKNVYNIKGMAIKDFYQICKEIGSGIFVTIGMDLIARAISFVSSERSLDTVAATTMIYKPGTNLHAVGLAQAIGRITGTARPDLQRTLYAPKSVIENYLNYNENQEQYLKSNNTFESMKKIVLQKRLTRPLDRTKLKLKPKYAREQREQVDEEIDGVDLTKLNNWLNDLSTTVAKMIKYLYDQDRELTFSEFKNGIMYIGSDEDFLSNIRSGQGSRCRHGKLWNYLNGNITVNQAIKNYIDSKSN